MTNLRPDSENDGGNVKNLFGEDIKTNNAIKHDRLRHKQAINADTHHHPYEKIKQLQKLDISGEILEVFSGQGNLTERCRSILRHRADYLRSKRMGTR